jgi:hypothetical protein
MNLLANCYRAALIGIAGLVNHGTLRAAGNSVLVTLKPVSGAAVAGGVQWTLLDLTVGTKQAPATSTLEKGVCKLTIMVADASPMRSKFPASDRALPGCNWRRQDGADGYGRGQVA